MVNDMGKKIYIIFGLIILILIIYITLFSGINENEAKSKAFEYAKVNAEDVTIVKIEKELFETKYDIEFYDDKYSYDVEVGKRGKIVSFEKEALHNNAVSQERKNTPIGNDIGLDKAKAIALKDAGAKESDVVFKESESETDNFKVYKIEFFYNNIEYQYDIKADNGEIISFEK